MCDYLPPSAAELLVSLARESEQLKIKIGQLEKDTAALKAKLSELEKKPQSTRGVTKNRRDNLKICAGFRERITTILPNIRSRFLFYHARGIKAIP